MICRTASGIVHLPAIFCIFMPDSFDLEHDWMSILLGSLEFEVKPSAMAPLLRFYATRFRLAQTAGSTLFMEEILVLIPRMAVILTMFVPAFGYIVGMISWVSSAPTSCATSSGEQTKISIQILVLGLLLSSGVCLVSSLAKLRAKSDNLLFRSRCSRNSEALLQPFSGRKPRL